MDYPLDIAIKVEEDDLGRDRNTDIQPLLFNVEIKVEKEVQTNEEQDWCVTSFRSPGDLLEPLFFKELVEPLVQKCALCHRYFTGCYSILKHNLVHLQVIIKNPKPFQCDYCASYFTDKISVYNHITSNLCNSDKRNNSLIHNNPNISKTSMLTYKPKAYQPINNPVAKDLATSKYGKIYKAKHKNFVPDRRLQDGITNTLNYKPKTYKPKPKRPKSKKLHQCKICNKSYTYTHWHAHMAEVHGNGGYFCGLCNLEFKCERYFTKHMKKIHSEQLTRETKTRIPACRGAEKVEIKCDECDTILQCRNALKTHKRTVHSSEKHVCSICKSELKCKSYLLTHMRRVHYNDGKMHACECGKKFRSPRYLVIHKKNTHLKKK